MDKAIPFPTEAQRQQDFFWTRKTPRPTAETHPYRIPALSEVQAIWDAAAKQVREHEERIAELRAERQAAKEKAQAERDAEFAAREAKLAEQLEANARARYLAAGGSNWEQDKAAVLRAEVLKRMGDHQGGALISPAAMLR